MDRTLFVSESVEETRSIAQEIVSNLDSGKVICLYGDLAAGKTTFTQGLGAALGIKRLTSPTFIIMREYPTVHPNIKRLYHLDLYRLSSEEEIRSFDLEEIWSQKDNLVVIEWPEKIQSILPKSHLEIKLKIINSNEREIEITKTK